jgi:hypothetical protein
MTTIQIPGRAPYTHFEPHELNQDLNFTIEDLGRWHLRDEQLTILFIVNIKNDSKREMIWKYIVEFRFGWHFKYINVLFKFFHIQ